MSASSARVALLDSGGANLGSVQAAFARLGVDAPVTSDWNTIRDATHVVLPGVGAAKVCMDALRKNGLDKIVKRLTQPLIGICVGMQLLFEGSEEGDASCLGLLTGRVKKIEAAPGVRVPHMGWNRLTRTKALAHPLMDGLDGAAVYFVHSYAASPSADTIATCHHGDALSAVVAKGHVMGAQFHPERSSSSGARLLKNFLAMS